MKLVTLFLLLIVTSSLHPSYAWFGWFGKHRPVQGDVAHFQEIPVMFQSWNGDCSAILSSSFSVPIGYRTRRPFSHDDSCLCAQDMWISLSLKTGKVKHEGLYCGKCNIFRSEELSCPLLRSLSEKKGTLSSLIDTRPSAANSAMDEDNLTIRRRRKPKKRVEEKKETGSLFDDEDLSAHDDLMKRMEDMGFKPTDIKKRHETKHEDYQWYTDDDGEVQWKRDGYRHEEKGEWADYDDYKEDELGYQEKTHETWSKESEDYSQEEFETFEDLARKLHGLTEEPQEEENDIFAENSCEIDIFVGDVDDHCYARFQICGGEKNVEYEATVVGCVKFLKDELEQYGIDLALISPDMNYEVRNSCFEIEKGVRGVDPYFYKKSCTRTVYSDPVHTSVTETEIRLDSEGVYDDILTGNERPSNRNELPMSITVIDLADEVEDEFGETDEIAYVDPKLNMANAMFFNTIPHSGDDSNYLVDRIVDAHREMKSSVDNTICHTTDDGREYCHF
ncbi:hypothetical protein PCE1_004713 [Barthelona sp. PCE]